MRIFVLFLLLIHQCCFAQKIVTVKSLFQVQKEERFFDQVNALIYMPPSYSKVEHFVYEDEKAIDIEDGSITVQLVDRATLEKRKEMHPIRKFGSHVYFQKGNIFIGCHVSWITLNSFFEYSNGKVTEEQQLKLHREHFVNSPEQLGLGNTFTLLEKLNRKLVKSVNADDVYIYKSNYNISYNSQFPRYGSIVVNLIKYDLGRISLIYYYPLDEYQEVLKEVSETWGTIRFKKDSEFAPNSDGKSRDLYFGKFSHLNDSEQESNERESYLRRVGKKK